MVGLDRRVRGLAPGCSLGSMRSSWRWLISAATFSFIISNGLAGDDTAWLFPNPNSPDQEPVMRTGGGSEIQGRRWLRLVVAEAWWVRWWSFEGRERECSGGGGRRRVGDGGEETEEGNMEVIIMCSTTRLDHTKWMAWIQGV